MQPQGREGAPPPSSLAPTAPSLAASFNPSGFASLSRRTASSYATSSPLMSSMSSSGSVAPRTGVGTMASIQASSSSSSSASPLPSSPMSPGHSPLTQTRTPRPRPSTEWMAAGVGRTNIGIGTGTTSVGAKLGNHHLHHSTDNTNNPSSIHQHRNTMDEEHAGLGMMSMKNGGGEDEGLGNRGLGNGRMKSVECKVEVGLLPTFASPATRSPSPFAPLFFFWVHTATSQWIIAKRYQQFLLLDYQLRKMCSKQQYGHKLPPLKELINFLSLPESKQAARISKYLKAVQATAALKDSEIFASFLGLDRHSPKIFKESSMGYHLVLHTAGDFIAALTLKNQASVQCMSQVGSRVFCGLSDGSVVVYSAEDYKMLFSFEAHSASVNCVVPSPGLLWTGSSVDEAHGDLAVLRIWNTETYLLVSEHRHHKGPITCLTQSSDKRFIYSGSLDGTIGVWSIDRRTFVSDIKCNTPICCMIPIEEFLWIGSADKFVRIIDLQTGQTCMKLEGHRRKVNCMIRRGNQVWSGDDAGDICIWDIGNGMLVGRIEGAHKRRIYALLECDMQIWSVSWDKKICVWDAETCEKITEKGGHTDAISSLVSIYNKTHRCIQVWTGAWSNDAHPIRIFFAKYDWETDALDIKLTGETIGNGSSYEVLMGVVQGYRAAVKKLRPKYSSQTTRQFRKKMLRLHRLYHPNFLLFAGACTKLPHLCYMTEVGWKGSLFDLLRSPLNQELSWPICLKIAIEIAQAMKFLHSQDMPILHENLKSTNVMIDQDWGVKLGNVRLNKRKDRIFSLMHSNRADMLWASPALLQGYAAKCEDDVYAFAIVLSELISGHLPFSHLCTIMKELDTALEGMDRFQLEFAIQRASEFVVTLGIHSKVELALRKLENIKQVQHNISWSIMVGKIHDLEAAIRDAEELELAAMDEVRMAREQHEKWNEIYGQLKQADTTNTEATENLVKAAYAAGLRQLPPEVASFLSKGRSSVELSALNLSPRLAALELKDDMIVSGRQLGIGSLGKTSLGYIHGVPVVLKDFSLSTLRDPETLAKEICSLGLLQHPNLVFVIGAVTNSPKQQLLVTEYLPSNARSLVETRHLGWDLAIRIATCAARGLQYLHSQDPPVIHGNLRASNVLLDNSLECIKLADYGLLEFRKPHNLLHSIVRWTAPEVVVEKTTYTKESDIYSLGMLIWELLTGKVPFPEQASDPEILSEAVRCRLSGDVKTSLEPALVASMPVDFTAEVTALLTRCWSPNPRRRPTIDEILIQLEHLSLETAGIPNCSSSEIPLPVPAALLRQAIIKNTRPRVPLNCPDIFSQLLMRCWTDSEDRRPSFDRIVKELQEEGWEAIRQHGVPRHSSLPRYAKTIAVSPDVSLELPSLPFIAAVEPDAGTVNNKFNLATSMSATGKLDDLFDEDEEDIEYVNMPSLLPTKMEPFAQAPLNEGLKLKPKPASADGSEIFERRPDLPVSQALAESQKRKINWGSLTMSQESSAILKLFTQGNHYAQLHQAHSGGLSRGAGPSTSRSGASVVKPTAAHKAPIILSKESSAALSKQPVLPRRRTPNAMRPRPTHSMELPKGRLSASDPNLANANGVGIGQGLGMPFVVGTGGVVVGKSNIIRYAQTPLDPSTSADDHTSSEEDEQINPE